jgi:predicted deacetylase
MGLARTFALTPGAGVLSSTAMVARLVISVHDVAPATATQSRGWLAEVDRRGVSAPLLVIPGRWRSQCLYSDAGFAEFLRERVAGGDDVVQHGWDHTAGPDSAGWRAVSGRVLARGAGEFAALSSGGATVRLEAGRRVLEDVGLETVGFTAPGWLHSPGTMTALRALGYWYTTDHARLIDLRAKEVPGNNSGELSYTGVIPGRTV